MKEDDILNLIHRDLSGVCTSEERQALEDWLEDNEKHRKYFNGIKKVWEATPARDVDVDFEEEWKRISRRLGIEFDETDIKPNISKEDSYDTARDNPLKYLLRVAAVILIMAIPAVYFADFGNESKVQTSQTHKVVMRKVATGRGERASMEFSDGSKITLNSMSTVRFPKEFQGDRREIYLEGEAFFKVTHNDTMPFIVHTNGVSVEVLGTEFNVSGYEEDKGVEVVVKNGKVEVSQNKKSVAQDRQGVSGNKSSNNSPSKVTLTEGQQTLVRAGKAPTSPKEVSLKPYLDWVNGWMIFDGTPMREVIPRLRRTYDLTFKISDSTILSQRLKASFKREAPDKVLSIISFSLDISYQMRGDTIVFNLNK